MWIHFIDNTAAEASLISGSSGLSVVDHMGLTWERIPKQRLWLFVDRVESEANPVDGLSRGVIVGPWKGVEQVEFPTKDFFAWDKECGGFSR